jgi:hypothetical protein
MSASRLFHAKVSWNAGRNGLHTSAKVGFLGDETHSAAAVVIPEIKNTFRIKEQPTLLEQ